MRSVALGQLTAAGHGAVVINGGIWQQRQTTNRLVSLPLGRDQLEKTGNLENFRDVTRGAQHRPARGLPVFDSDVYKWLEAIGWELGRRPEPRMAGNLGVLSSEVIGLIRAAQAPDGYIGSWYRTPQSRFSDLLHGLELYNAGHLFQAGVAWARGAGDDRLLNVSERFADYIATVFGPGRRDGIPEHPGIEMALVELYRTTGAYRYLELAEFFLNQRGHAHLLGGQFGPGYRQDDIPFRDSFRARGHAVMAAYLACGALDVFAETGDRGLLDAAVAQWEDMVSGRMYVTGGVGSRHKDEAFGDRFELPPDRAYCETCAAIGVVMWSWRLLLITGEVRYADLIERVLFNAFAAGVSLDGRSYFYVNPLQVRAGHQDPEDGRGRAARSGWYEIACCPPNVMRTLSSLDNYFATTTPDGVQIWQFAPSQLAITAAGHPARLTVATGYPSSGRVSVRVEEAGPAPFEIALRVPAWCRDARGQVTSASAGGDAHGSNAGPVQAGALWRVHRRWHPGDELTLDLAMPPRLTVADPRIDAVRGCVVVERGPLVYCLEEADAGTPEDLESARLDGVSGFTPATIHIGGEPVTVLRGQGHTQPAPPTAAFPYHTPTPAHEPEPNPAAIQLIPYYAWGNRHPGQTMRTWIPAVYPLPTAGRQHHPPPVPDGRQHDW